MEKKILNKLPNTKALDKCINFLKGKIRECEGEIPEEFWCNNCKRLKKKVENILEKVVEIGFQKLKKLEDEVENKINDFHFLASTPTFKYKCSSCGYIFDNSKQRLWPPSGVRRDLDGTYLCSFCGGIVEEIKFKTQ